jgi:hypothetical protein
MKEMDPSEELLMERAMMEDEDLLIEVESMRQTLKKLDKLPQIEPPAHVQDAVMQKASLHTKNKSLNKNSFTPLLKYAVAATLALTFTAGGAWYYMESGIENERQQLQTTETTIANKPAEVPAGSDKLELFKTDNYLFFSTVDGEETSEVEPWIDRNDVLHFEDQDMRTIRYEAILKKATQKLRPIDGNPKNQPHINSYQLTGSGN